MSKATPGRFEPPSALRSPPADAEPAFAHRIHSRIVRAILWGWAAIGAVDMALSQVAAPSLATAAATLATTLCGLGTSVLLHRFMLRRAMSGRIASTTGVIVAAIAAGAVLWTIDVLIQAWVAGHPAIGGWPWEYFLRLRLNLVYFSLLFVLQGAACELLGSELKLETRERQLLEARLAALRFQLNPHFVFNTLNALSTMVEEGRPREAGTMIARLSDFLRATLADDPTDLVPLDAEIDLIQAYLGIEAVRFGDRLAVHYSCDPGLADAQVPSLILQPLVENAIKYAVAPSKEPVTISIEATSQAGDLTLVVEDDGRHHNPSPTSPRTGVGLANTAARLEALYGQAGRVEAVRRASGFTAMIRLPLARTPDA